MKKVDLSSPIPTPAVMDIESVPGSSIGDILNSSIQNLSMDESRPGCLFSVSQMTRTGYPLHQTSSTINLLQQESTKRRRKWRTSKVKKLTVKSNTLEIITDNCNTWTNKKCFNSSKKPYVCRIPKRFLTNANIRQKLRFKAHKFIRHLRMKQQLFYGKRVIEAWSFEHKSLVRPKGMTGWRTLMKRDPNSNVVIDPTLTTRAIIKTQLYDGYQLLHKHKIYIVLK